MVMVMVMVMGVAVAVAVVEWLTRKVVIINNYLLFHFPESFTLRIHIYT